MTYETNVWYGWNGGECPVHPETVVEVATAERGIVPYLNRRAGVTKWRDAADPIIAFRVIKEHKEPREFWVHIGSGYAHIMKPDGVEMVTDYIHVREVIE